MSEGPSDIPVPKPDGDAGEGPRQDPLADLTEKIRQGQAESLAAQEKAKATEGESAQSKNEALQAVEGHDFGGLGIPAANASPAPASETEAPPKPSQEKAPVQEAAASTTESVKVTPELKTQAVEALEADFSDATAIVKALAKVPNAGVILQRIVQHPRESIKALSGLPNDATAKERVDVIDKLVAKVDGVRTAEKTAENLDYKAEQDRLLTRLREANPEAAKKEAAEYADYQADAEKENAKRVQRNEPPVAPMDRRDFAAGWYVAHLATVAAGALPGYDVRKDVEALQAVSQPAVDRYLLEVGTDARRKMAENCITSNMDAAGVERDQDGARKSRKEMRTDPDGDKVEVTVYEGKNGNVEFWPNGVVRTDKAGHVVSRMPKGRESVSYVGRSGYPVSNAGKSPEEIGRNVQAAKYWDDFASEGGFGFAPAKAFLALETVFRQQPSLSKVGSFAFGETIMPPSKAQKDTVAHAFEKLVGKKDGEIFNPDNGYKIRPSFTASLGGQDPQSWLRNRFYNGWEGEDGTRVAGPAWNGSPDPVRMAKLLSEKEKDDRAQ